MPEAYTFDMVQRVAKASSPRRKPGIGCKVVMAELPPGLLQGLPREDQNAIRGILGKPVLLEEYDEDGRAVLAFKDSKGIFHSIFVSPSYIRAHG